MRTVVVSSFLPVPENQGDPVRVAMFLRALAVEYESTALVVERDDSTPADVGALQQMLVGMRVTTFPSPPVRRDHLGMIWRWLASIASRTPSWIRNRRSRTLEEALLELGTELSTAFLLGESAGIYASSIRTARPTAHIHWDKSNVLSASAALEAEAAGPFLLRLRKRGIAWISHRYERRVVAEVDTISVTSEREFERLLAAHGRKADAVIPSSIRLREEVPPYDPEGSYVLWLGAFSYGPNVEGLRRFIGEGMGSLRGAGLRLRVVGSGAAPDDLRRTPDVEFLGYVEHLEQSVVGVRAGVVPLWTGAGVKLKTLTLLNLGLPVASTPQGVEGIPHEAALLVADSGATLASGIASASTTALLDARRRGRAVLTQHFTEESFRQKVHALTRGIAESVVVSGGGS